MDESQARRLAYYYPELVEMADGLLEIVRVAAAGKGQGVLEALAKLDARLADLKSKMEMR